MAAEGDPFYSLRLGHLPEPLLQAHLLAARMRARLPAPGRAATTSIAILLFCVTASPLRLVLQARTADDRGCMGRLPVQFLQLRPLPDGHAGICPGIGHRAAFPVSRVAGPKSIRSLQATD